MSKNIFSFNMLFIRLFVVILCSTLILGGFFTNNALADDTKIRIVTTIFPIYDWVREVLGDTVESSEIIMLMDSGADLHNFQPTASDILTIKQADLFIYIGGESDDWVDSVLSAADNPDRININLMEALGNNLHEEETVEGMDTGDEHEHDHEEEEETEYDEHIWLSLRNAGFLVQVIADKVSEINADQKTIYMDNAQRYQKRLADLDAAYEEAVAAGVRNTLLFADRFPFRYLAEDYHLAYYAAFSGCSAETEASFETVFFLAQKLDELNLPVVLTIENPNTNLAETIIRSTQSGNRQILAMNSMQSITSQDLLTDISYLSVMSQNLEVLKQALQ